MEECRYASDCVLFSKNLTSLPEIAMLMKERHCRRDFEACALFMVASALGKEKVPDHILPNQTAKAMSIIRDIGQIN